MLLNTFNAVRRIGIKVHLNKFGRWKMQSFGTKMIFPICRVIWTNIFGTKRSGARRNTVSVTICIILFTNFFFFKPVVCSVKKSCCFHGKIILFCVYPTAWGIIWKQIWIHREFHDGTTFPIINFLILRLIKVDCWPISFFNFKLFRWFLRVYEKKNFKCGKSIFTANSDPFPNHLFTPLDRSVRWQ